MWMNLALMVGLAGFLGYVPGLLNLLLRGMRVAPAE